MKKYERVYASINMDAIRHNIDTIAGTLKEGTGICAVLKADAYGHGAAETVRFLEKMKPVTYYAVATVDEANILREAGGDKPILILGACFPKQYEELVAKEYLGLEAEEREVYVDELADFAECGLCGTAAVISPVGKIVDHGKEICLPSGMTEMGPTIKKLYDTLTGIQMGRIEAPEGWIKEIM